MKKHFAVWRARGPNWNATLRMREQHLWAEHAAFMNDLAAEGFVILGGPLGEDAEILLIIRAASKATVVTRLDEDPWSKAGLLAVDRVIPWEILLDAQNARRFISARRASR